MRSILKGCSRLVICLVVALTSVSLGHSQNLLSSPESVVYDPQRDCYLVSNWGDGAIVRIDSGGVQSYFNVDFLDSFKIAGLYVWGDTLLAAAGDAPGAGVAAFDLATGDLLYTVPIPGIGLPNDITSDADGYVYVTDYWGSKLYRIWDREPSLLWDHDLNYPNGIAADLCHNRLLILSVNGVGYPILAYDLTDSTITTVAYTQLSGLDGIAFDYDHNLYLSEWVSDAIYIMDSTLTNPVMPFSFGHSDPADIYYDVDNNVLAIPNFGSNTVDFISLGAAGLQPENPGEPPRQFELSGNFPNPFNPTTTISYALPTAGLVNLSVFDIAGKRVAELVNGMRAAGSQQVTLDGSNLSSGIYFCRLQAGGYSAVQKMILIK